MPPDGVSLEVVAKYCDIAEPDREEEVDESLPDEASPASPFGFLKGRQGRKGSTGKSAKPDIPRSVQIVLDKTKESLVLFEAEVARVSSLLSFSIARSVR